MKNFILIAALLFTFSIPSIAGLSVPTIVQTTFMQKFPNVSQVQWNKENGHYVAKFMLDDQITAAVFQENGPYIETDITMDYASLPPTVTRAFEAKEGKMLGVMVTRIETTTGDARYNLQYRTKEGRKTNIVYNLDGSVAK